VLARQVPEETLAREPPQLDGCALQLLSGLELRQLLVALIDLFDVERLLEPREMEVVLLVEVADEAIGLVPKLIEFATCWRLRRTLMPRIRPSCRS